MLSKESRISLRKQQILWKVWVLYLKSDIIALTTTERILVIDEVKDFFSCIWSVTVCAAIVSISAIIFLSSRPHVAEACDVEAKF